ncbi:MAG: hemerythrin domain-containing protein [Ginsengibacter sp.]
MKKKPIKRNENLVKLSKDHHASLLFCWKLRQGIKYHVEIERLLNYVQYFWLHHFSTHFKEEEEFLFKPFKDELAQKAMDDHQKIKNFIDQVSFSEKKYEEDILLELAEMVDQHVRYEERILFPHLEGKLSDEQLKTIGKLISKEPLMDSYGDDFWTKSSSL